jgi:two-component system, OmpR family, sensor histidine kinase MprB
MTLRNRLALAAAVAVALAVAGGCIASYLAVRAKMRGEVDTSLRQRANELSSLAQNGPGPMGDQPFSKPLPEPRFGGAPGYAQVVAPDGQVLLLPGERTTLPVAGDARRVTQGDDEPVLRDVKVNGTHLRVVTAPLREGFAIQIARPLSEVDSVLHSLVIVFLFITAAGVALAVVLGRLVARTALAPVERFTAQTELIAEHPDEGRRIDVEGEDELARLAASFNATLDALERSLASQRQLVADASHELRTPLASVRTNIEVLARGERLVPAERERLVSDIIEQIDELTALVADVVELARGAKPDEAKEQVRLDELAAVCTERARRHAPDVTFETRLDPVAVTGNPQRLHRAISNLLDNAAKWSPPGGVVEVEVRGGSVTVRDRGPGIKPQDLPHVFDRFYRAPDARSMPGSGLGLAIVKQVAESHGGTAIAANAEDGGALMRLSFPSWTRPQTTGMSTMKASSST